MRFEGRARRIGGSLLVAGLLLQAPAWCFPGVIVGKDDSPRKVHTTHEVMMLKDDVSVITVMVDYDGPINSFAVLMPVPADVTLERVQAVKREFLSRLEQLSAPRYHAFYEKDPCEPGQVEQDWDVRYEANEPGFLAPSFMPPPERNWTVSNEIGIATKPVFKRNESEFHFQLLQYQEPVALEAWLLARGYRASPEALSTLARGLEARKKLLVAEVNTERAELLGNGGLQLGGIRYFTRESASKTDTTLGLLNSAGVQDLFLYVLHPSQRYQARNYQNVFLPSNVGVESSAEERVAPLYNALFDAKLAKVPEGFVTEFVWPTYGCGEPCPNAPLTLYELMSLGGDVMEAQFVPKGARFLDPGPESNEEKQEFELHLLDKSPIERAKARIEHQQDRKELARRRALIARQRYVMTRLHYRYDRNTLPRDIELAATDPIQGGIGIPQGSQGSLFTGTQPARENRFQMRFVSVFAWTKGFQCSAPARWRWGRRWKSLDAVRRKVWLAEDLPRNGRDKSILAQLIRTPLAELGLAPAPTPPHTITAAQASSTKHSGCALAGSGNTSKTTTFSALLIALSAMRRRRRPTAST